MAAPRFQAMRPSCLVFRNFCVRLAEDSSRTLRCATPRAAVTSSPNAHEALGVCHAHGTAGRCSGLATEGGRQLFAAKAPWFTRFQFVQRASCCGMAAQGQGNSGAECRRHRLDQASAPAAGHHLDQPRCAASSALSTTRAPRGRAFHHFAAAIWLISSSSRTDRRAAGLEHHNRDCNNADHQPRAIMRAWTRLAFLGRLLVLPSTCTSPLRGHLRAWVYALLFLVIFANRVVLMPSCRSTRLLFVVGARACGLDFREVALLTAAPSRRPCNSTSCATSAQGLPGENSASSTACLHRAWLSTRNTAG